MGNQQKCNGTSVLSTAGHKRGMVQDFIAAQQGRIHTAYVSAYAPDLNPVEYLWGYAASTAEHMPAEPVGVERVRPDYLTPDAHWFRRSGREFVL